jgi:hypothetical protein
MRKIDAGFELFLSSRKDYAMFLSLLYAVLIGLALIELAIVVWSVNFLRKYAFRAGLSHDRHEWSRATSGMRFGWPRNTWAGVHRENAANQEGELFGSARQANRRH